jgi:DNA-binding response OmpR family regulator
MSRVLVVEDESHLAEGLRFNLEAEGYTVDIAGDGESALKDLATRKYDVVVLDVMLPGKSGFDVARSLRDEKNYVPVLMLTARGQPEDVLEGFAAGADDYLPKPFELPIFLARLQGLLRRTQWMRDAPSEAKEDKNVAQRKGSDGAAKDDLEVYSFDGTTIDFPALELRANGNVIQLTWMEAKLLRHLIRNAGKTVSRKSMLEDVWGLHEDTDTRAIDNFIVRLRRYIEKNPSRPRYLVTVRGVGYRFAG